MYPYSIDRSDTGRLGVVAIWFFCVCCVTCFTLVLHTDAQCTNVYQFNTLINEMRLKEYLELPLDVLPITQKCPFYSLYLLSWLC